MGEDESQPAGIRPWFAYRPKICPFRPDSCWIGQRGEGAGSPGSSAPEPAAGFRPALLWKGGAAGVQQSWVR